MTVKSTYVFVTNNMYNSSNIRELKWWNKIIGFPGETVVATINMNVGFSDDAYKTAKEEFAEGGFFPQCMGYRL
ncbi:hypothetical protein NFB56_16105 [Yersinia ruckeri]|uniref:hypothetical protein n=1 Tax=Yersinia ruckeri TaxID=29486 RepID=UPI0022387E17|nr:hypothetical protein [Yersinia ruckeri]MCW6550362.1 hypothetical protein [Yersinia ruckeri]